MKRNRSGAPDGALPSMLALALGACAGQPHAATHGHGHGHGHEHGHGHAHGSDEHGTLVHRFENADEWSKRFDAPDRDAWQRPGEVVSLLAVSPGMTVADVGAGTGYFLPHLSRAVGPSGTVLALDVEPGMVRHMKERAAREGLANVRPVLVRGDDPGLPAGKVDRILVVDTWHHIPKREAYAEKLRAALAPGGFVAIVDFTAEAGRGPPKEHRISPEQVMNELRAGGLAPSLATESLPDQYVVLGERPGGAR